MEKMKEFNYNNSKAVKTGFPFIGLSQKTGCIRLNKDAVALLELKTTTPIVFVQDEDQKQDWYIAIKEGGFPTRVTRRGDGSLSVNCSKVAKQIASSCNIDKNGFAMNIGYEPTIIDQIKYYPIITKSAK